MCQFTRRFCGGATSYGENIPAFFNGESVCARSHCSAQPGRQRRKEGYAPAARQILVGTRGSGKRLLNPLRNNGYGYLEKFAQGCEASPVAERKPEALTKGLAESGLPAI